MLGSVATVMASFFHHYAHTSARWSKARTYSGQIEIIFLSDLFSALVF